MFYDRGMDFLEAEKKLCILSSGKRTYEDIKKIFFE